MIGKSVDFARRLRRWYERNHRDLPWRALPPNPYHVLVSEAMLQQTQVVTVIPYFLRFLEKFPTVAALANADPQVVLHAWQGLGYYSRARNLQSAARKIIADFGGEIPTTVEQLLTLPGIGRYTAGAIASIAFERRAPILEGNVVRVLCRIDAVTGDPRDPIVRGKLWQRAEEILPRTNIGDFNSALMELGALICTPRLPQCLICPVREHCQAQSRGVQNQIPAPKAARPTPLLRRWTFCINHGDRYLTEQRPAKGRWAGMWQFSTIEAADATPSSQLLQSQYSLVTTEPVLLGRVEHALTHRRYEFDVFRCRASTTTKDGHWATLDELRARPMPRPHLKIREMLEA